MKNDLVSIVMPTYNSAQYIRQSIESVLEQTYTIWELLIVDDGSTDGTWSSIRDIIEADERISYIRLEVNSGAAVARNVAIKQAKGRYIAMLDSDDVWASNKLEKQITFMQSHNYAFSYTNYLLADAQLNLSSIRGSGPKHITPHLMNIYGWISNPSVIFDMQVIGRVQGPNIRRRNDYALWLKVIKKADCYLLDEDLLFVRKHKNSISSTNYFVLIYYFYKLWRTCENKSCIVALLLTGVNIIGGIYKKLFFQKKCE